MDWEKTIPLMKNGYHKKLIKKAYGKTSKGKKNVFPPEELVFNALELTPFKKVKCVIIGQDPYINQWDGIPEAHGLSFSVKEGVPVPPSLKNIFKEIGSSIYKGKPPVFSSDLTRWAKQDILLLNSSLTVVEKKSNSHANLGWHKLTDEIIETISLKKRNIVFMLWGAFAQKKESLIDKDKHCVLKTSHPSPLSAYRGFTGSGVFLKCNNYLLKNGLKPVVW